MDLVPWCNGVLWTLNPAIRVQISVEPSYLTHLPEHSFIRIITEVTLPREEVNIPRVAISPLTTRWSKSATLLWKIPVILVLYRYRCNFYTVENFVSAVRSKKQNHFITYTTHFRSLYVPKSRFFGKKAVHCSGALLKIRKRFSSYLLNGYRYHKNFNRFKF